MGQRLEGKVAIVTGGASGIGEAMVHALHAEGARVVIGDISGNEQTVAAELGERVRGVRTDVSKDEDVRDLVERTVAEFGRLDILCNNAGIGGTPAPLAEWTPKDFDSVLNVNLRGVYHGLRHGIPAMLAGGGGSIINTSSAAGFVAFRGLSVYGATKAGIIALTRSVAVEYGNLGIRANAICPGGIMTPAAAQLEAEQPAAFAEWRAAFEVRQGGRMGSPPEIGAVAAFLASDESSFLNGASIRVDGGYTAV